MYWDLTDLCCIFYYDGSHFEGIDTENWEGDILINNKQEEMRDATLDMRDATLDMEVT